jgi:hypothetical protein
LLDDDRLSLEFVHAMRESVSKAVLRINADLALRYAETGLSEASAAHLSLIMHSGLRSLAPSVLVDQIVSPIKARVRHSVGEADKSRLVEPSKGDTLALGLLNSLARYRKIIERIGDSPEGRDLESLYDEVATQCLTCVVAFHHATSNNEIASNVLTQVLAIARGAELRGRLEENIATGRDNRLLAMLSPILDPLQKIEESKGSAGERLAAFLEDVQPSVTALAPVLEQSVEVRATVFDRIARLLRNISIDAWNLSADAVMSLDALNRADTYAVSAEVKNQLGEDRAQLTRLYSQRRRELKDKRNKKYGWAVAAGVVIVIVIVANWNSATSTGDTAIPAASPMPATTNPSAVAGGAADTERTYRVPSYMTADLARERATADAA